MKIGTAIATVATPIARALRMNCIDPATQQLRPESNCAKMRDDFDNGNYINAALDRIRKRGKYRKHANDSR